MWNVLLVREIICNLLTYIFFPFILIYIFCQLCFQSPITVPVTSDKFWLLTKDRALSLPSPFDNRGNYVIRYLKIVLWAAMHFAPLCLLFFSLVVLEVIKKLAVNLWLWREICLEILLGISLITLSALIQCWWALIFPLSIWFCSTAHLLGGSGIFFSFRSIGASGT